MKRKKGGLSEAQPELTPGAASKVAEVNRMALAVEGPPALVEFKSRVTGKLWRVEKFAELSAAVGGLEVSDLPRFHEMLDAGGARLARCYLMVRRVYGMRPVLPGPETSMDDLRVWSMQELANSLGCAEEVLMAETQLAQGAWNNHKLRLAAVEAPAATAPAQGPGASATNRDGNETRLGDELTKVRELLTRYRFDPRMFEISGRDPAQNEAEMMWCAERMEELRQALENRYAREPARMMILNELSMHRETQALLALDSNDPEKQSEINQRRRRIEEMQGVYNDQLTQVNTLFPFMDRTASAAGFKCALSELVEGFRKFAADGRNDLIDGFQTAYEVQVQTRQSVQMPQPKYRPSLVLAVNEARAGLWDPNFKSQLEPKHLLRLDHAWAAAYTTAAAADGVEPTDLESDDPKSGEYPPIYEGEKVGSREEGGGNRRGKGEGE